MKFDQLKIMLFEEEDFSVEKAKTFLVENSTYETWDEYVENMIPSSVKDVPHILSEEFGITAVCGKLTLDEAMIVPEGLLNEIDHCWNEVDGNKYDFTKGAVTNVEWLDVSDPSTGDDDWRYVASKV